MNVPHPLNSSLVIMLRHLKLLLLFVENDCMLQFHMVNPCTNTPKTHLKFQLAYGKGIIDLFKRNRWDKLTTEVLTVGDNYILLYSSLPKRKIFKL